MTTTTYHCSECGAEAKGGTDNDEDFAERSARVLGGVQQIASGRWVHGGAYGAPGAHVVPSGVRTYATREQALAAAELEAARS